MSLNGGSLTCSYGTFLNRAADVKALFYAGYDFVCHSFYGSGTCSVDDFENGCYIQLRYGKRDAKMVGIRVDLSKRTNHASKMPRKKFLLALKETGSVPVLDSVAVEA